MAMLSRDCSEAAPLPRKCCRRPIILYVYFPNCATVGCIKCGICADVVGSAITSANAAGASSSSSSCKFTDLEVTEVFASLEAKREEWKDASDPEVRGFIVRLMGGKYTREHLGVDCDAFRGMAVGKDAGAWCVKYSLKQSAHFALNEPSGHGEYGAHTLALEWCRKM